MTPTDCRLAHLADPLTGLGGNEGRKLELIISGAAGVNETQPLSGEGE